MRNKVTCNPCSEEKENETPQNSVNTHNSNITQGAPEWLTTTGGKFPHFALPPPGMGGGVSATPWQTRCWREQCGLESSPRSRWRAAREKGIGGRTRRLSPSECPQWVSGPIWPRQCHSDRDLPQRRAPGTGLHLDGTSKSQLPTLLLCSLPLGL